MLTGIYFIDFKSARQNGVGGLIVVDNGRVHGGDPYNLYRGHVEQTGDTLKARIRVTHYRGPTNTVFGPLKDFELELTGRANGPRFSLAGNIVGKPQFKIEITGDRKAELVD